MMRSQLFSKPGSKEYHEDSDNCHVLTPKHEQSNKYLNTTSTIQQ